MNLAHLHLLMNHIPVIGALFGIVLFAVALSWKSSDTAKIGFASFVVLSLVALAVYLTGEPAEELVENLPGVSEAITETHEEVALIATIAIGVFGALSLGTLVVFRKRRLPGWVTVAGLVSALSVGGAMGWTAFLGGQIRHTEIRSGAVATGQDADGQGRLVESDER